MFNFKSFYQQCVRVWHLLKKPEKEEVKAFLTRVAEELGHKKFSKQSNSWEDCYAVTINSYIQPDLAEKLKSFC